MPELPARGAAAMLLAVLIVAGIWPFLPMLGWLPWGSDAAKWVARGSIDADHWVRWAFASKHFVGYRPVTALSFTLNTGVTGYEAWGFRVTDLSLHLLNATLIFVVARRVFGLRSVFGLVPVLLVLGHPAVEEVVPFVARRSYLLAQAFGLGAILLLGAAETSKAKTWAAAGMVAASIASNECGYALVPALVALVAARRGVVRAILDTWPIVFVAVLGIMARAAVLGTLGGYEHRYFAYVQDGTPVWRELFRWEPATILLACWRYAVNPGGPTGQMPLLGRGPLADAFGLLAVGWLVVVGLRGLRRRGDQHEQPLAGPMALVWLATGVAIVVASQTWFWRQAYPLLAPLGLLLGMGFSEAAERLTLRNVAQLTLGAVCVCVMGFRGPLVDGMDLGPHLGPIEGTPVVARVRGLLPAMQGEGAGVGYLVVPLRPMAAHNVRQWADRYAEKQSVTFRLLGHLRPNAVQGRAALSLDRARERPTLTLRGGLQFADGPALPPVHGGRAGLEIDRLWQKAFATWLVAIDLDDAFAIRVPEPPSGTPPIVLPGSEADGDDFR